MAPLTLVIVLACVAAGFAWTASLLTGDTSWVDRLWSVVPIIYVWVFAAGAGLGNARLDAMALVVSIWGIRLTFNFARRGGYSGVEDYRWAVLRGRMNRWQFQIFNLCFIVLYQNALLVLITLPALTALQNRSAHFGALDALLIVSFLTATALEALADQQQWDFHVVKRARMDAGGDPRPRFCQSGLFRYSRHPNYFFELTQWWLFFLLGASAAGSLAQWTVLGAFLLTMLFIGSTRFTESITLAKYPEYEQYQRRTSAVVPWRPGPTDSLPPEIA